jgi:N-acetylglutamate synthase-like GNAT family acetyltransferase
MSGDVRIERAGLQDLDAVLALLAEHNLPADGLVERLGTTLIARRAGKVIGTAALEIHADGALLRSVAVSRESQGQGVGKALTEAAIAVGEDLHAPAIYLLTTTAERYFPKLGFERTNRDAVPASVKTSVEFKSACPASAVVMRRIL